jgi:hypothetical protein
VSHCPRAATRAIISTLIFEDRLTLRSPRFRQSLPIRVGAGIIVLVTTFFLAFGIAYLVWGFSPEPGPVGIWSFFLIIVGIAFIVVGIGQQLFGEGLITKPNREDYPRDCATVTLD